MQDVEHKVWCLSFCSSVESGCMLISSDSVLREILTTQLEFYLPLLLAVDALMAQCTDLSPQDQEDLSIRQIVLNKVNQASGNSWCELIKHDKWTKKYACLQSCARSMGSASFWRRNGSRFVSILTNVISNGGKNTGASAPAPKLAIQCEGHALLI